MRLNKGLRTLVLFLAVFILIASFACAAEYVVIISPEYRSIKENEVAEYRLTVTNNMATTENFEIYSPDVMWDVSTKPASDRIMRIESGESKGTTVQLKPLYVNPGLYGVSLNVRMSGRNMLIRNYLMVGVTDLNPPPEEYLPAIRSTILMDDMIDPRDNITIKIELQNQNRRTIPEMDIRLRSDAINTDYKTGLGPLEKKVVAVTTKIDPLAPPHTDVLRVLIFTTAANRTYQYEATPFEFEVINYGGLEEDVTEIKEFMKTTRIIKLKNVGNGGVIDVYTIKKGFFERMFTSAEPEWKKFEENGTKSFGWPVTLDPFEEKTITVVVSYRLPFGILMAAVIIIVLYFLLRSPIIIHKSATVLATKEGGISELKVLILVKNRSANAVKDVTIIDKVPHIADVMKEFEMGTLHPSKVLKHEKKGTLIKWAVPEFDKFEERVLSYKIKSRLSVLGEFKLPVVIARFVSASGRRRSAHSNAVSLIGT